jgi:hypothetical protein
VADTADYSHGEPEPLIKEGAVSSHDLVVSDLHQLNVFGLEDRFSEAAVEEIMGRKAFGLSKYPTVLHKDNGRDHGRDAQDEIGDYVPYLRTWLDSIPPENHTEMGMVTTLYQAALWQLVVISHYRATGVFVPPFEQRIAPPVPHPEEVL